jgi:hypothetical protein
MENGVGLGIGRALLAALTAGVLVAGCNPLPRTVASKPLEPIQRGSIRRIAVLPFTSVGLERSAPEPGEERLPEPPADTVTRAVRSAMEARREWELVDEITVGEALRQLFGELRAPTPEEARRVGQHLRADAVLRGQVTAFEERIGSELAAKRPARVAFAVELLRVPGAAAIWQAQYADQQQSLSENLWNLPGFVRAGGTWVRAGELAAIGADQVVTRLHETLFGPPPRGTRAKKK